MLKEANFHSKKVWVKKGSGPCALARIKESRMPGSLSKELCSNPIIQIYMLMHNKSNEKIRKLLFNWYIHSARTFSLITKFLILENVNFQMSMRKLGVLIIDCTIELKGHYLFNKP